MADGKKLQVIQGIKAASRKLVLHYKNAIIPSIYISLKSGDCVLKEELDFGLHNFCILTFPMMILRINCICPHKLSMKDLCSP